MGLLNLTQFQVPDYNFQDRLHKDTYRHLLESGGVVLAAAPNSGKTRISIGIIDRFLDERPRAKVLVLTHGQTWLRSQFYETVVVEPRSFTHTALESRNDPDLKRKLKTQVHVAIPQFFTGDDSLVKYDLIIVDEAHNFYPTTDDPEDCQMVRKILVANPKALQLLLTGTPSAFIALQNQGRGFPVVSISLFETLKLGIGHAPYVELAQTSYPWKFDSLNAADSIKKEVNYKTRETSRALVAILDKFQERLADLTLNRGGKWSAGSVNALFTRIGKTLIVCHSIAQAKQVVGYFQKKKVGCLLSVSESSEMDPDDTGLKRWRTQDGSGEPILVVVNRARLGFSYDWLMNIIDMSGTHNPDLLFQMLCRVVRAMPTVGGRVPKELRDRQKTYLKLTSNDLAIHTRLVMNFVAAMQFPEVYAKWDGRAQINVPVRKEIIEASEVARREKHEGKEVRGFRPPLPSYDLFSDLLNKDEGGLEGYAYCDIHEISRRFYGREMRDGDLSLQAAQQKTLDLGRLPSRSGPDAIYSRRMASWSYSDPEVYQNWIRSNNITNMYAEAAKHREEAKNFTLKAGRLPSQQDPIERGYSHYMVNWRSHNQREYNKWLADNDIVVEKRGGAGLEESQKFTLQLGRLPLAKVADEKIHQRRMNKWGTTNPKEYRRWLEEHGILTRRDRFLDLPTQWEDFYRKHKRTPLLKPPNPTSSTSQESRLAAFFNNCLKRQKYGPWRNQMIDKYHLDAKRWEPKK